MKRRRVGHAVALIGRELLRDEIEQVWNIDRSEVVDNIYHFDHGALVLRLEHYDVHGRAGT